MAHQRYSVHILCGESNVYGVSQNCSTIWVIPLPPDVINGLLRLAVDGRPIKYRRHLTISQMTDLMKI